MGLGNPGSEYARSRHNAGADTVALLAARYGERLKRSKELALAQFAQGAKYIFAFSAAGNSGIFEAAKDKGFFTSGVDSAYDVAAASRSITGRGVAFGASRPSHSSTSKPGSPDSATVGKSGSSLSRCNPVVATARNEAF